MPKEKRKVRSRSSSIARRLNSALVWRKYLRNLLCDILLAALFIACWCVSAEFDNGGRFTNVSGRRFSAENVEIGPYSFGCFTDDVQEFFTHLFNGENPKYGTYTLFDGIYYHFDVTIEEEPTDGVPHVSETEIVASGEYGDTTPKTENVTSGGNSHESAADTSGASDGTAEADASDKKPSASSASPMAGEYGTDIPQSIIGGGRAIYSYSVNASATLIATLVMVLITFTLQTVISIVQSLGGGRYIKKYLRPIDDMALMAEKLSADKTSAASRTAVPEQIRREYEDLSGKSGASASSRTKSNGFDSIEAAIDLIDNSKDRVDLHQTELDGIESAINNMLRRLDEERRKQMRFVDDASHELRTPIAVLQGYVNMLDRWGKDDPTVRDEAISAIKTEVDHMQVLVDQLLFLARGEMDRHVLEIVKIDVYEMLCEIFDESNMLDSSHEFVLTPPDSLANPLTVMADAALLKQCIRIIRDNAIRYTPEGGTISLKAYARSAAAADSAGSVCIEVSDNGIGIPADELPRIFDRLFRGSNARTHSAGGSGLGLSLALCIVEKHSGKIEAVSSQGVGTRMTIVLPMSREN